MSEVPDDAEWFRRFQVCLCAFMCLTADITISPFEQAADDLTTTLKMPPHKQFEYHSWERWTRLQALHMIHGRVPRMQQLSELTNTTAAFEAMKAIIKFENYMLGDLDWEFVPFIPVDYVAYNYNRGIASNNIRLLAPKLGSFVASCCKRVCD